MRGLHSVCCMQHQFKPTSCSSSMCMAHPAWISTSRAQAGTPLRCPPCMPASSAPPPPKYQQLHSLCQHTSSTPSCPPHKRG
jgi:hypothetical protein